MYFSCPSAPAFFSTTTKVAFTLSNCARVCGERVEGVEGKKKRYRIPVCGRIHPDPLAPDSDWLPFPYRRAYKALGPGLEPILR